MRTKTKKVVAIFILIAVTVGCFLGMLVKQRIDKEVTIPYSMYKIHEQLSEPENIIKWFLPFAGMDSSTQKIKTTVKRIETGESYLEVTNQSIAGSGIVTGNKNGKKFLLFSIIPDSINTIQCDVQLSYNTTLFKKLFGGNSLEKDAVKSLENLKAYMEDTKKLYGFEIGRETVIDTSFLFSRRTVPQNDKQVGTKKIFEDLIAYAEKNNLGYTGTRIFYTMTHSGDQVTLYASIGISKRFENTVGNVYEYKAMPAGKNLLVAIYQGPYGEANKAYSALEQYKSDYLLSSMAIPFQKFMNEGYDFADDQVVQLKVYYPIF